MDELPANTNAIQAKSRRRWYQFTLRTLLIVVTLAGCGFGWLGLKFREARRQQASVAAIEKLGGRVQYDYEFDSRGNPVPNATAPGPKWLHSLLGNDLFGNVEVVDLSNTLVTDADLERLEALRATRKLFLDGTEITDTGLEHLKGLTQLRVLALDAWRVTDAGVVKVRRASPDCYICRVVQNKINVSVRRAPR